MKKLMVTVVLALSLINATVQAQQALPNTVRFGVGVNNLPLSTNNPPFGFEVDIAHALAKQIGVKAEFVWLNAHADSFEQAVLDGRCDVAMGAIMEAGHMAGERTLPGVRLTKPYYSAGYLLVRRAEAPPLCRLSDLGEKRLAIEAESIVAYTLRQRGYKVHLLKNNEAIIQALSQGKEDYAYLWGPLASWQLQGNKEVVVERTFVPEDVWKFALATRRADVDLWNALNRAIRVLVKDGTITRTLAVYGG